MCRMIGHLEHRNVADRALPPTALPLSDAEAASQDLYAEAFDPIEFGRSGEGEHDVSPTPRPCTSAAAAAGATQDTHQDVPVDDLPSSDFSSDFSLYDFSPELSRSSASASASALP